ncbi:transporter [Acinetobacter puyangensis]|uniref:transporter n=1 Tax=Acinetobacter puyangensis TaxID=1096779 RepID=UPI003A4D61A9
MKKLNNVALSLMSLCTITMSAHAVDVDAGDYDYAPSGVNLGILYYQHATRDAIYAGSDRVAGNPELTSDIGIARYVHYMDVAGVHIAPQILVPFGRLDTGKDIAALGSSSGIGDIILANTFFVYHDPQSSTTVGITPYLYLPTGQYDKNDALNLGENRYKLILQGAYTTKLSPQLAWDAIADVTFYGKNDDIAGGGDLKQDMGYQLQTNLRYKITNKVDIRGGLSYADAGDSKLNGVELDSNTQSKFWIGTGINPTASTQLIVNYGRDFKVENGFKEDNRINLRFMRVF